MMFTTPGWWRAMNDFHRHGKLLEPAMLAALERELPNQEAELRRLRAAVEASRAHYGPAKPKPQRRKR